jgi:acyl-CoA thioesterase-2
MNPVLADLLNLLQLERIEDNIFRGESRDIGGDQVFGGQVLGQALSAAHHTVDIGERIAHSLHAYFLRRGDVRAPIIYDVDRARDGGSFSVRRVVAIQHGRPIFNLAASFHKPEQGLEHQAAMPDVEAPAGLKDVTQVPKKVLARLPEKLRRYLLEERPFEFRPVRPVDFTHPEIQPPVKHLWIKALDKLPDDTSLHQNLLAYVSDYELLGTCILPHDLTFGQGNVQMASLDHALWFHRPFRVDDWLLYSCDSPNASGARGLARGQFFTRDGTLIASAAQEGLIRVVPEGHRKPRRSDPRLQA